VVEAPKPVAPVVEAPASGGSDTSPERIERLIGELKHEHTDDATKAVEAVPNEAGS
jgi:hypothetical protein